MKSMPNDLVSALRPGAGDGVGTALLLHEALARSRQREAVLAARRYALARPLAAGRTWSRLARFAARARAAAGVAPQAGV